MAAALRAQLWLDLLFPSRLPLRLQGEGTQGRGTGTPCPHPLYPGPPALCGQSRDPSQGKLEGDGGHVAGDNRHQAWPLAQFPPDLGVTKEMFPPPWGDPHLPEAPPGHLTAQTVLTTDGTTPLSSEPPRQGLGTSQWRSGCPPKHTH